MVWIVVLLSVAMVMGGIAYAQPTPRQKIIAKLRTKAIQSGFKISEIKVSDTSVEGRINQDKMTATVYRKLLTNEDVLNLSKTILIQRTSGENGIYLPEGWAWESGERLTQQQVEPLHEFILALTDNFSGIELSKMSLGLLWNERGEFDDCTALIKSLHSRISETQQF
jgi:hypothetical protein